MPAPAPINSASASRIARAATETASSIHSLCMTAPRAFPSCGGCERRCVLKAYSCQAGAGAQEKAALATSGQGQDDPAAVEHVERVLDLRFGEGFGDVPDERRHVVGGAVDRAVQQ